MALRAHQQEALAVSLANDFQSGVHFHATGTGKSWVALELALAFQTRYPKNCNILWICEQKSILIEQFSREIIEAKGYAPIFRKFLIQDYTVKKPVDWVQQVNSAKVWGKPILILVNRAFLVSSRKYEALRIPLHLLIHDECHSITNKTTREFYEWTRGAFPTLRYIGFSATPNTELTPYNRILSSYTIYDACADSVIVPPRIIWVKSEEVLTDADVRAVLAQELEGLPYKKLVVWCGMIETCLRLAAEWGQDPMFRGWTIAVDTSASAESSYADFQKCQGRGLLFCASKHREGSDIPLLDGCIFLDRVENRNAKTFLQCMGRVLRRDPAGKKTHGLVLDISAKSSIKLCDRMNQFLNSTNSKHFPFTYSSRVADGRQIHCLQMTAATAPRLLSQPLLQPKSQPKPTDLQSLFRRSLPPNDARYTERLQYELAMLREKNLEAYLLRALEILDITHHIPHITRGSCGSSLVCYLLGISHVDPIRWNIRFARFLNEFRDTLPDIDFDFPHILRDEVFMQIHMRWPGQVARISNHVHYHQKSALREAIRHVGIRRQIPALQMNDVVRRLSAKHRAAVQQKTRELENTFRGYSLHCGGIVFYPAGIPDAVKLRTKKSTLMSQIILNKQDVAKEKHFKIDILSSRALSQLLEARKFAGITADANSCLAATDHDAATADLFRRGDNIGITLAESPLIRKAFMRFRPTCLEDVALCLAIIRPAARDARAAETMADLENMFVYDDDAIEIVSDTLGCSDAEADQYRRAFSKGDKKAIARIKGRIADKQVLQKLANLRKYSFCKSHAYSYAQLVWQLGYMKAHYPAAFWRATLKHCQSSYRRWVHLFEARLAGVGTNSENGPRKSIFAENRRKKLCDASAGTPECELRGIGIWSSPTFYPECGLRKTGEGMFEIRGLIAASRVIFYGRSKRAVLFVGFAARKYIEVVVISDQLFLQKKVGISAQCICKEAGCLETDKGNFYLW